ncbi:sel1 repeat family protein [uncultured Legionella sp.]|uniref:tetratricopeptide repeat protein n=1 Tax=uncultured Legionella sp. TaxID=210934 RepID=UPI0026128E92|nr:sel1 repeat family protein [uncultured Legionella sp.]
MKRLSRLLVVLMFIPMMAACIASSFNLREGIQSFKAQDYRRAFIRLKPEAARGQPDAQYAIGYMYYYGQGVVEDRKKAWYWINMAAQAGQADAIVATKILEHGSQEKKRVFQNKQLQHYPKPKILF